jgi:hypothetical protein
MLVPDEVRKCVAFVVYQAPDGLKVAGTAFFVGIEVPDFGGAFQFAVTAKHVIEQIKKRSVDGKVYLRMNFKNEPASLVHTSIDGWLYHPSDSSVDVAVSPFLFSEKFDHLYYPVSSFATKEVIEKEKIGLGDEVFLAGMFYGHLGKKRNIPIVRVGNIAAMPEEPVDTDIGEIEAYLVESRSISGLSGSPVFVHLGVIRPNWEDKGGHLKMFSGVGRFYLLGLMHGHFDKPISQEDTVVEDDVRQERVNMGIAVVVPATKILEVIHQPYFDATMSTEIERVRKEKIPKPDTK